MLRSLGYRQLISLPASLRAAWRCLHPQSTAWAGPATRVGEVRIERGSRALVSPNGVAGRVGSHGRRWEESMEELCLCAFCREILYAGDALADNYVYKLGELSYIELAHRECAKVSAPDSASWCWE